MEDVYRVSETYEQVDFTQEVFPKGEYDSCTFNNCQFHEVDLSSCQFLDCSFIGCNLSMVKLKDTSFRDVSFAGCKMLGMQFADCNTFSVLFNFDDCQLDHSSFYKLNISKTVFKNSSLDGIDFTETELISAVFDNCNLQNAMFDATNLESADFYTAYNYTIDPQKNKVQKACFSQQGVLGLLTQYDIRIEP